MSPELRAYVMRTNPLHLQWYPDFGDDTIASEGYRAGQADDYVYGFLNPVPFGLNIREHTINRQIVYS